MISLLIAQLIFLILPFFISSWRANILALAGQSVLITVIAYSTNGSLHGTTQWVQWVDFGLVRSIATPLIFYSLLRGHNGFARKELNSPSLLSWTLALTAVLISFNFSALLIPEQGNDQTRIAVVIASVLLGFVSFTFQTSPLSQAIGVLRLENAIALFEIGEKGHALGTEIQIGLFGLFIVTIALISWTIRRLNLISTTETMEEPIL